MRLCVAGDISRASSRIFTATPIRACLQAGRKGTNDKKSAVGGKKKSGCAGTKKVLPYYLSVAPYKWNNTSYCFFTANGGLFERPTAAFFTMAFCVYIISLLNPNQPNAFCVYTSCFLPIQGKAFCANHHKRLLPPYWIVLPISDKTKPLIRNVLIGTYQIKNLIFYFISGADSIAEIQHCHDEAVWPVLLIFCQW